MQRHTLFAAVLVLSVALPAQARHTHAKTPAKAVATEAKTPVPAPIQVTSSSKGSRLIAQTPSALPSKPAAKATVAKADKSVKSSPSAATASLAALPTTTPPVLAGRLARLTAYWTQEDPWTAKHESSTGVRLHEGACAVDPKLIPYGSQVQIPGMGNYVAVDTGSAVISRQAALGSGRTEAERNALVVDLFFESRREAEDFAAHGPAYVAVSWSKPIASADSPLNPRALPAVPTLPAGAVYVLAQAPAMADSRMPLAFRSPQTFASSLF